VKLTDLGRPIEKTVSCLIYAKSSQKILLLKRSNLEDQPGEWCMPGGHVDQNEKDIEAAIRECREETGIDLAKSRGHAISKTKTDWPLIINTVYAFEIENEPEPVLNWESDQYGWFELGNLPDKLHWTVDTLLSNDLAAEILHKKLSI
jgi:8-oxo-dGTP pyrophosphatase MutT (NUDIX family)